ncbi:unnamed protein product [Bursaphelenchus okinawaensis]|uniref:Uncharacterized protein n=1 Tax=Bursaphelenchus okinawaensis TaxID=465554 RepID=A0A811K5W5_9BILA|nr:unnamed protein product [Bursaphelenchus okinawaensis]CAG9092099.1 unnamed protein product [Bursaphelenchus okinawaensis]
MTMSDCPDTSSVSNFVENATPTVEIISVASTEPNTFNLNQLLAQATNSSNYNFNNLTAITSQRPSLDEFIRQYIRQEIEPLTRRVESLEAERQIPPVIDNNTNRPNGQTSLDDQVKFIIKEELQPLAARISLVEANSSGYVTRNDVARIVHKQLAKALNHSANEFMNQEKVLEASLGFPGGAEQKSYKNSFPKPTTSMVEDNIPYQFCFEKMPPTSILYFLPSDLGTPRYIDIASHIIQASGLTSKTLTDVAKWIQKTILQKAYGKELTQMSVSENPKNNYVSIPNALFATVVDFAIHCNCHERFPTDPDVVQAIRDQLIDTLERTAAEKLKASRKHKRRTQNKHNLVQALQRNISFSESDGEDSAPPEKRASVIKEEASWQQVLE